MIKDPSFADHSREPFGHHAKHGLLIHDERHIGNDVPQRQILISQKVQTVCEGWEHPKAYPRHLCDNSADETGR